MILRRYNKLLIKKGDIINLIYLFIFTYIFLKKEKRKKTLDLKVRVLGCKQAVRLSGFLC